LNYRKNINMLE